MSQVKVHQMPSMFFFFTPFQTAPYSATVAVRPVSFLEVMDEELAQKMQKEVEPISRTSQTKNQSSNKNISNNRAPVTIQTNFKVGRSSRGRYGANDYVYFEEEYEEMEPEYEQFEEPAEEELDDDLKLALQLSEQESSTQTKKSNDDDEELKKILELSAQEVKQSGIVTVDELSTNAQPSEDEDYKLALKLQEELESEAAAQRLQERQVQQLQQHRSGSLVGYATEFMYDKSWQEEEEDQEEEEEEYYEEDDEEGVDLSSFTQAEKLNHYASKYGGRVPRTQFSKVQQQEEEYEESDEMITKHDPVISGFKNAETLERLMDTGNLSGLRISAPVFNRMREKVKTQKAHANRVRGHQIDKSTSEQVLDNRTRVLLLRLMNNDIVGDLDGIISSGKEANVYHAMSGHMDEEGNEVEPVPCAIKIYKTTLNEFKNRSEYIDGEFRFRHQTRQHNPMKLIKMWAEKETRNLKRLNAANIPSPVPVILRDNVLIMTFIGKDGFPAPRLKDIPDLTGAKLKSIYEQCVKIMRTMYHECHLVHADMSEYNLLYQKRQVHVIDVAQAVEWDHPNAMEFLKKDCTCMSNFFRKKGLSFAMSPKQLFDFVVDIDLEDQDVDKYLEKMEQIKADNPQEEEDEEFQANERLFQQSFIPRTLDQVPSPVKELYDNEIAFHQSVHGLSPNILAQEEVEEEEEEEEESEEDVVVDETWVVVESTQL